MKVAAHHRPAAPGITSTQVLGIALLCGLLWLCFFLLHASNADSAGLLAVRAAAEISLLRQAARAFTLIGDWEILLIPLAAGALVLLWQRRVWSALFLLFFSYLGDLLVNYQKVGMHLARPDSVHWLAHVTSATFPSGHAANSMTVYLSIALLFTRMGTRRFWLIPAAVMLSALIGISRVMLGVHWPTDVGAGWSFGAAWALVWCSAALALENRRESRLDYAAAT